MRGLPRKGLLVALFLGALVSQIVPAAAQGDPVARVIKISEGGRLDYSRADDKWYQAYLEMKDYKNDKLRTDDKTFGSIEFYTGGQIGINKNTTVEITSDDTANVINLKGGGLWGKMAKQKEKPVHIRTSSGVMGIRGTEFVIEDGAEGTEVSVLEGVVEVTPEGQEEPVTLNAGDSTTLKLKQVPVVTQSDPEDLRKNILNSQEWEDFNEALRWARTISSYVPGAGFSRELYWAGRGIDLVTDPEAAVKREVASQVNSRVGFGIGSAIANSGSSKKPDFPSNLRPDGQSDGASAVSTGSVNFSWDELKGAQKYFVMVGRDEAMDDLVWTHQTGDGETSVSYPSSAAPLTAGKYFWRVIGLDKKGEPVKKAAQTWFNVQ